MLDVIKRIFSSLSSRRKLHCILLLFFMLLSAFAEVISIGAVIPFIGVITNPDEIQNIAFISSILNFFSIETDEELLLFFTLTFIIFTVISGIIRVSYIWIQSRLTNLIGSDLSVICFRHSLYQPYTTHLSRNSSELVSTIFVKIQKLSDRVILNVFLICSSSILIFLVFLALLFINPYLTFIVFSALGSIYFFISYIFRGALNAGSEILSKEQDRSVKVLQESFGGIRELLIDGTHETYIKLFQKAEINLRSAVANLQFIGLSPRYLIETIGIVIFAIMIAYNISVVEDSTTILATFGAIALAATRLLPHVQGAYAGYSGIFAHLNISRDVLDLVEQNIDTSLFQINDQQKVAFEYSLKLSNVSFAYPGSDQSILSNLDLEIASGSRVGIIGVTGSGKSTLMDILMGLLIPTSGSMEVDGLKIDETNQAAWKKNVVHVPQTIFLCDATIAENIAFGESKEEIDIEMVKESSKKAHAHNFINSLEHGYDTLVGERGSKLSGGQRQRIGIARAILKKSNVLFLDEATNALDDETELNVMKSLYELDPNLTLIMVAHRKTTLKHCSIIIEIKDGKIYKMGSYKDVIGT
ncbi:ATP-binding cassette domain-containing protein [Gammaproteobacteria bacterium]|nr:ATP-binding cassette domain-containing protein [Gammaproteobacteria bacterium]MDC0919306.1 ATP-binding cassette domain-containing protein [Gammaproteobacteria bacterium]